SRRKNKSDNVHPPFYLPPGKRLPKRKPFKESEEEKKKKGGRKSKTQLDLEELQVLVDLKKNEEYNKTIYCICRKMGQSSTMIQCDECKEWMHTECIRIDAGLADHIHLYYCDKCVETAELVIVYEHSIDDYVKTRTRNIKSNETRKKNQELLGKVKIEVEEEIDVVDYGPRTNRCEICVNCYLLPDCNKCFYCVNKSARCKAVRCFDDPADTPDYDEEIAVITKRISAGTNSRKRRTPKNNRKKKSLSNSWISPIVIKEEIVDEDFPEIEVEPEEKRARAQKEEIIAEKPERREDIKVEAHCQKDNIVVDALLKKAACSKEEAEIVVAASTTEEAKEETAEKVVVQKTPICDAVDCATAPRNGKKFCEEHGRIENAQTALKFAGLHAHVSAMVGDLESEEEEQPDNFMEQFQETLRKEAEKNRLQEEMVKRRAEDLKRKAVEEQRQRDIATARTQLIAQPPPPQFIPPLPQQPQMNMVDLLLMLQAYNALPQNMPILPALAPMFNPYMFNAANPFLVQPNLLNYVPPANVALNAAPQQVVVPAQYINHQIANSSLTSTPVSNPSPALTSPTFNPDIANFTNISAVPQIFSNPRRP
ncbi:hypothetical protein PFISCL1PPCAC_27364, partial [Pristionchus fissidentatus]